MNETVILRQYVQGHPIPYANQPQSYSPNVGIYAWWYDLRIACHRCTYTVPIQGQFNVPSAELAVAERRPDGPIGAGLPSHQGYADIWFRLIDPSSGSLLQQSAHSCPGGGNYMAVGGYEYTNVPAHSHYAEVDLPEWLRSIERKLNERFEAEREFDRLRGTIALLQDRLGISEEELQKTKGRNVELARQIREIHEALDCPCEMPLDTYDLMSHLVEMGVYEP